MKWLTLIAFIFFPLYFFGQNNCSQLNFDGVDDYVEINSLAAPLSGVTNNFTIEFWMKGDKNDQPSSIRTSLFSINPITSNGNGLLIIFGGTNSQEGKVMIYDEGTFGTNADYKSTQDIGDMVCHHIAYVRDGNTGYIYIDGVQVGSHNTTYSILPTDLISIGQEWDNLNTTPVTSQFFKGNIDEFRVWSQVKNQAQIQAGMNTVVNVNSPNLLAYYKFDQGIANGNNTGLTNVDDVTANNHNGALNGFNLNGSSSNYILNDCILCSVDLCKLNANFLADNLCLGDTTNFLDSSIDSIANIISWKWYFGDGDSLIGVQNPSHFYSNQGTYNVLLVIQNDSNCIDSITIPLTISQNHIVNTYDSICKGNSVFLAGAYQFDTGVYIDSLQTKFGCDSIVITNLFVLDVPNVYASHDTIIEKGQIVQLSAYGANSYVWSPITSLNCYNCQFPIASPKKTTEYIVKGYNEYCFSYDSIIVEVNAPEITIYVPNSFTPDGDQVNDRFYFYGSGFKYFEVYIFNRWGELLYESKDILEGWDGTYRGENVQVGVYIYRIRMVSESGVNLKKTGHINLLR